MGFWSTLGNIAGVGLSLIPGVGPVAGGLIKLATGVGGAIGDSVTGSGKGGSAANGTGQTAAANATAQASKAATTGNQYLGEGQANLDAAGDSYRTALNGSQEQLQALLGPEVNTVMSQYDNAAKTAATFGPRGGGRTGTMAELPFAKAGAAGKLLSSARAGAAAGLTDVGGKQSATGAQLSGQVTSQLGPALAPGLQEAKFAHDDSLAAGTGIGKILGNIFGNKAGGGGNGLGGNNNGSGSNEGGFGGGVDIGGAFGGNSGE